MLALGVSEGFTYEWDATQPQGSRVVNGSMMLNGQPIDLSATYRVGTLSFLAQGGDAFTAFTEGTNLLGGPEDLQNLVDYLEAHPGSPLPTAGSLVSTGSLPGQGAASHQGAALCSPPEVYAPSCAWQHRWVGARQASSRHTVSAMPTPPAAPAASTSGPTTATRSSTTTSGSATSPTLVIAHLEAENTYAEQMTEHLEPLRQAIFDEIRSRTQETDLSVPVRSGDWWYYTRTFEDAQYSAHCRSRSRAGAAAA